MRNLNAHRLLQGTASTNGYIEEISVEREEEEGLRVAKDMVREAIREGFRALGLEGRVSTLLDERFSSKAHEVRMLAPRFRMQGSFKYRTLNEPCFFPPQEIDVDYGVYLPTSFVTGNGAVRPAVASRSYFTVVEGFVEPLCKKMRWTLDRSKPSCVRIKLSPKAHIDLPLYAIPDDEFVRLAEDAALSKSISTSYMELSEDEYRRLPKDKVMLARRTGEWMPSDPRKIEDWFLEAIGDHGEIIRDVCRYVKGWRDYKWKRSSISSIMLMACVVETFDSFRGTFASDRHDLALLAVAKNFASQFHNDIQNPVLPDQVLNEWADDERQEYVRLAKELHQDVDKALNGTLSKELAIRYFQNAFGDRIPTDTTLIIFDGKEAEITSYPRVRVIAPEVPRTTSG